MQFINLKKQYEVLKDKINDGILGVLSHGNYIGGEEVGNLANALQKYVEAKYCLPCANGTDALTIALRCLDVKQGDAVFVPDFTFFASAETVATLGAQCIFVDVDPDTFNISPTKLEEAIIRVQKEGKWIPKTIIAVDLFGLPADYIAIAKIAKQYGLSIIEDGAQGFGGSIGAKKACSFGDISTTSFFPAKPLGCYGDGGAIFTDNKEYFELMSSLAVHGKGAYKYDNVRFGYNSRLDTIQAAILLPKLKAFEDYELEARSIIANRYTLALKDRYKVPIVPNNFGSSWAQYTLILDNAEERNNLQARLKDKNIPSMVYYPLPMHSQSAFQSYKFNVSELEVSTRLSQCVLSIPMHPYLEESEQQIVIDALMAKI